MKPTAKRAVRIVFIITVLWITFLQYVVLVIARAEPYPAVILPGFPANCPGCLMETGLPTTKSPELRVRFADGHTQEVSIRSILPPGPSVSLLAFSAAFADPTVKSDPETIAWLQSRTERLFPHEDVVGFDILWRSTTYKAADESAVVHVPLYTINVDFGAAK
jgi:hypothetical protein